MKKRYPTDLTDAEWKYIEPFVPASKRRGRQRVHSPRGILNALFYVLRSGCAWRLLPREYPPWKTVYHYFRQWRIDGTFEKLNAVLREHLRICLDRNPRPSAGIADSQSAKTTGVGGEARGYDGGKKIRGRKRHLLVDTEGLVLKVKVHSAKIPEQDGLKKDVAGVSESGSLASETPVVGCWLRGQGQEVGRRGLELECGGCAQASQTYTGEGGKEVGRRVGQGGREGRLAKAHAAERLSGVTPQMGSGKDLLLALSEQEDEQGLREVVRNR